MPKKLYENGPAMTTPSGRAPHRGGVHASEFEMWTGTGEAKNLKKNADEAKAIKARRIAKHAKEKGK